MRRRAAGVGCVPPAGRGRGPGAPAATEALWQLERQVNTKIVLQVLGANL